MPPASSIDDAERRFNHLIDRHKRMIRNLCWFRAFMHDEYYCADLIQRCYLALWRHLSELPADADRKQETSWVAWRCRSVISQRAHHRPPDWLPLDPTLADTLAVDTTGVGIADVQLVGRYVSLQPNPATERVRLVSSFGLQRVEIYNAAGARLREERLAGYAATLAIGDLPEGAYLLRIHTPVGPTTKKLIVRRR